MTYTKKASAKQLPALRMLVGVTRFELATSRPPDAHSNRTELHPVVAYLRANRYSCGGGAETPKCLCGRRWCRAFRLNTRYFSAGGSLVKRCKVTHFFVTHQIFQPKNSFLTSFSSHLTDYHHLKNPPKTPPQSPSNTKKSPCDTIAAGIHRCLARD